MCVKMTMKILAMIFLAAFSIWNIADANTEESFEMRVYDRDGNAQRSSNQIQTMLESGALQEHGFKLQISSRVLSDKPSFLKTYFYYKIVDCSQVPEVNDELEALIPGIWGNAFASKVRKEIRNRHLGNLKQCHTGLEVHYRQTAGSYSGRVERRAKRGAGWCIGICFCTKVTMG